MGLNESGAADTEGSDAAAPADPAEEIGGRPDSTSHVPAWFLGTKVMDLIESGAAEGCDVSATPTLPTAGYAFAADLTNGQVSDRFHVSVGCTHTILDNSVSTGLTLGIFETIVSPCLEPMRQWGTPMTVYGYARVSTTDQSLDIQIAALKAAGCEKIRSEKVSGTSTNGRQELKTLLEFIDAGDVLMVTRIDRLARSIGDLQDIVRALEGQGRRATGY